MPCLICRIALAKLPKVFDKFCSLLKWPRFGGAFSCPENWGGVSYFTFPRGVQLHIEKTAARALEAHKKTIFCLMASRRLVFRELSVAIVENMCKN